MITLNKDGKNYKLLKDSDNSDHDGCLGCALNQTPLESIGNCLSSGNNTCIEESGTWKLLNNQDEIATN